MRLAIILIVALSAVSPCSAGVSPLLESSQGKEPILARPSVLPQPDRLHQWALDFQTASLWRITDSTFLDYWVVPQIISLRTPAHLKFKFSDDGDDYNCLIVRSRFTILVEAFARGPESYYLGWSGSPSIEYWINRDMYFHFSIGGGAGFVDSQGVPGGQGQDFTYNWFVSIGFHWYVRENLAIGLGGFYQHLSNRGATEPNPGLDALGPMLSVSWMF